jgi:DNA-binding NtrC family response regulator
MVGSGKSDYLRQEETTGMAGKLEVVIVDDEPQITDILKAFVLHTAPETIVRTFNDSVLAREFIVGNHVDVLITDHIMPGLDGIKLLESAPPEARKIILSGRMIDIGEQELKRLNATFLEKPTQLRALAKIIWPPSSPLIGS